VSADFRFCALEKIGSRAVESVGVRRIIERYICVWRICSGIVLQSFYLRSPIFGFALYFFAFQIFLTNAFGKLGAFLSVLLALTFKFFGRRKAEFGVVFAVFPFGLETILPEFFQILIGYGFRLRNRRTGRERK
jgi:hypothetical protein